MTDEELEAMEIDWTQGVAENFERVKSAALAALDAANRRADEAEARMYSSQRIAIAAEAEIDTLRARVAELEAGGCARDQGTTQYCAEAVALQKRVAELEGTLKCAQIGAQVLRTMTRSAKLEVGYQAAQHLILEIDAALNKEPGK
ncbi:MAG TPA: hypothetical protein DCY10_01960 [Clostridiales bacterium]|nr:hypothetical protein [Clostridiales bacterium]